MRDLPLWKIWLVISAFFAVLEVVSTTFFLIWFAIGALAGSIIALLGFGIQLQIGTFLLLSVIMVIFTRPLVNRFVGPKTGEVKTNLEKLEGQTAIVIEEIDSALSKGLVKIGGNIWSAFSLSGKKISQGESVRVIKVEGVKLLVEKIEE